MYEYANRLAIKGYKVTILHSIRRPFKKSRTPVWLRYLLLRFRRKKPWFAFHPAVRLRIVREVVDRNIPDADITISTWWQMAYAIARLSESKGKKVNLIQDYEIWTGQDGLVHESYKLPIVHVVIAKYLIDKVQGFSNMRPLHIPNAIDVDVFRIRIPIEERNPYSVIMLYSEEERKGTKFGLAALSRVRERFPTMTVTLFGVYPLPADLPDWIDYHHKPNNLPELYNRHAIFFSPSLGEGWALPPAEAMACGCAVVCTDIGGHHDYATDRETAYLVAQKDVEQMAVSLNELLENQEVRLRIARNGHQNIIAKFNWSSSVLQMESIF